MKATRQRINFGLIPLCLIVTVGAKAQNPSQFKNWKPLSNEVRATPKLSCPDLRSLTGYEFSIITASAIAGTADVPEHCLVSGQILPEIRFEIDLPVAWKCWRVIRVAGIDRTTKPRSQSRFRNRRDQHRAR